MANEQFTDLRIYGATNEKDFQQYPAGSAAVQPGMLPEKREVPLGKAFLGNDYVNQGYQRLAENRRPEASILESVGAAATQWLPIQMHEWYTQPTFTPDKQFNPTEFIQHAVDFPLNNEDLAFMQKARSADEAKYRLGRLEERDGAYKAMGDHAVASFLASAIDPGYLAIDAVSMGVGRLARLGGAGVNASRIVAGVTAGAATAGAEILRSEVQPVTVKEIVANALLNAAATTLVFNPAKRALEASDAAFPGAALTDKARRITAVQSVEQIAEHAPNAPKIDPDAKAVYLPNENRIFVVQENIKPGDDVKGILMHEFGVHMNAERVLGSDKFTKMIEDLQNLANNGNERAMSAFRQAQAVGTQPAYLGEEALGYYVEANHAQIGNTIVSQLKDGVKAAVRAAGVPVRLSETEIMNLVRKSASAPAAEGIRDEAAKVLYSKGLKQQMTAAAKVVASSEGAAEAISWSWHKSFSNLSPEAAEVADIMLDNPLSKRANSVASIKQAIHNDLKAGQYVYEDLLTQALSERGFNIFNRIGKFREAARAQQSLETAVYSEMVRRNRLARDGVAITHEGVDPAVKGMADALDRVYANGLREMQSAGVKGADEVAEIAGYLPRRWDSAKLLDVEKRMESFGLSPKEIMTRVQDSMSVGIQRATGMDAEVASDIAKAIFDRTKRKGMFQDTDFSAVAGKDAAAQVRDLLADSGIRGDRAQRVIDVIVGKVDEAGKLNVLKNRMDMALDESIHMPDGSMVTLMDLVDTNVTAMTDRYMENASSRSAFARKGMPDRSDIAALRDKVVGSLDNIAKREEAAKSFDQMVNVLSGQPVGEEMLTTIRRAQDLTQMVGLAFSGVWQMTEYAPIMAHYGAAATMASAIKEMPYIRTMYKESPTHLKEVLTRNAAQDTRLRPFVTRLADNFEIPLSDAMGLAMQQAKQLVPYMNAMKYIQYHQARTVSNLIVDTFVRAAKGDAKAVETLGSYGLEQGMMNNIAQDIAQHGLDTAKWADSTWQAVRGPLTSMMDDSVLRARVGEVPQFAHTSTLGKFLFTFRNFTLASHNKVLANTLANHGYSGLGLLMLYQIPMTILATAANQTIAGKNVTIEDATKKAMSQVGAFGLFSELFGAMSGEKQQWGSPGLIFVDRMYKLAGALKSGSVGNSAAAMLNVTPVLSASLPLKAIGETLKEKKVK